jgi:outer membrane protein insertion porin family
VARSRLRRIVLRTLAILAGTIAVCLLLIAFGLFPQGWLQDLVENQVRAALGPESSVGSVHVVPGRLRADAQNVVIEGRGYKLEIPSLRLALAWPAITGKSMALRSVEMERPVLTLWPVEPSAPTPPPDERPMQKAVLVGDVNVSGGTVVYHDPALGGDWRVENVTITGGIGTASLKLQTGPVRWERPDPLVLEPVHGTLSISPLLAVNIDQLEAGIAHSRVIVTGTIGDVTLPKPDLKISTHVDLADAARLAPALPPMTGLVSGEGQVTGMGADLKSTGRLEGKGLHVAGRAIESAAVKYAYESGKTQMTFDAAAVGGRLNGTAAMHGTSLEAKIDGTGLDLAQAAAGSGTSGRTNLHASVHGTMNERLETAVQFDATGTAARNVAFTAQGELGGAVLGAEARADLQWKASGTADQPPDASGRPTLQKATWTATGTATGPFPPAVAGTIQAGGHYLSPAGDSAFTVAGDVHSHGAASGARLQVAGDLGQARVNAATDESGTTVDVDARDLHLERFVPETRGTARFAFQGTGLGEAFRGQGEGAIADLEYQHTRVGPVTLTVESSGRSTTVKADVPEYRAHGEAALTPVRRGAADLAVTAHLELRDTPLDALAASMPDQGPVKGRVTGTFDVAQTPVAALAKAKVAGRIDALQLDVKQVAGSVSSPFTFEASSDVLQLNGLAFAGAGFSVEASGTFGLTPNGRLDGTVKADADLARLPAATTMTLAGNARADLRLSGTRARPVGNGFVDLTGFNASGAGVPPLHADRAHIEIAGDTVRFMDLNATLAGGSLRATGIVPLAAVMAQAPPAASNSAHIDVVWQGVEAAQVYAATMPASETTISGKVDGEAHLEGPLTSMEAMTAHIRTPPVTLTVNEMPVNLSGLVVDVHGGQLALTPMQVGTDQGSLELKGGADLRKRTLDFHATGNANLRSLSPFLETASVTGRSELDLSVTGTFDAPRPQGRIKVQNASVRMREIQPPITDMNGAIVFEGETLRLEDTKALWGGGPVELAGTATLKGAVLENAKFTATGRDLALRYMDARVRVNADLTLTGKMGDFLLAGKVDLVRALYEKDIFLDEPLHTAVVEEKKSPLLSTIGLDLRISTVDPFLIQNNLASLQAGGDLRITGDASDPAPFGTLVIEPEGKVTLQGHTFVVDADHGQSTIRYDGDLRDPTIAIYMRSDPPVSWMRGDQPMEEVILVSSEGRIGNLETKFELAGGESADIAMSQTQIVTVLVTGREDASGEIGRVVGEQAAALLAGRASQTLTRGLRHLGFDEVTIEPNVIAQSEDPSARFTFGKNLTSWSTLFYSMGLTSAEDRFVMLRLRPFMQMSRRLANFTTEVRRDEHGEGAGAIRHKLNFGAVRHTSTTDDKTAIAEIRFEGRLPVEEPVVRQWLSIKVGQKLSVWTLQDEADRIRKHLVELGHMESQVSARLDGTTAVLVVRPGPRYVYRVEGMEAPPDLQKILRSSLYAEEALDKGEQKLLEELRSRGFYRAEVRTTIDRGAGPGGAATPTPTPRERPAPGTPAVVVPPRAPRTLVFAVTPGPSYVGADAVFEGASALSASTLRRAAGGVGELIAHPAVARQRMEQRYRDAFYLKATVGNPRIEDSGNHLIIHVPVEEGPLAHIAQVRFEGISIPEADLLPFARGLVGTVPEDLLLVDAAAKVREHYFGLGRPHVRVATHLVPRDADLELAFQVEEGPAVVIREIVVQGRARINEDVLRADLPFKVGDPLDPRKLSAAEARLRKYSLSRASVHSDDTDAGRVIVDVAAPPRATLGYSLQVDSASALGYSVDAQTPNLLANGISPGVVYTQDAHLQEGRAYMKMPAFFHRGFFNSYVSRRAEDRSVNTLRRPRRSERNDPVFPFTTMTFGASQQVELGGKWQLEYGYQWQHVADGNPLYANPPLIAKIGKTYVGLLRDTRDNILDARRGRFWSINTAYGPPLLGSNFSFFRVYGQVNAYRGILPGITWAQSYRLGLGWAPGDHVFPFSEKFEAGGPNSLRGFATASVGPALDESGGRTNGAETLVLNQELRYHHPSGLGAAVFYDVGNVWESLRDIGGTGLRHDLGAGVRYDSPVGLLRFDFAVPLNRRPGDDRYQYFFSIGQSF